MDVVAGCLLAILIRIAFALHDPLSHIIAKEGNIGSNEKDDD
jgi:hypothetical protein